MQELQLVDEDFIPLCDLLKKMRLCSNGAEAKHVIAEGKVKVNGNVELRKRCKIVRGQTIDYNGQSVKVV